MTKPIPANKYMWMEAGIKFTKISSHSACVSASPTRHYRVRRLSISSPNTSDKITASSHWRVVAIYNTVYPRLTELIGEKHNVLVYTHTHTHPSHPWITAKIYYKITASSHWTSSGNIQYSAFQVNRTYRRKTQCTGFLYPTLPHPHPPPPPWITAKIYYKITARSHWTSSGNIQYSVSQVNGTYRENTMYPTHPTPTPTHELQPRYTIK